LLADAGVALLVYIFVRREAGPRCALAAWLGAACFMAQPLSANPFPLALLWGLAAIYLATRDDPSLVGAGALTALAAAFRLDFGVYAGAAVLVALLAGRRWRAGATYAGVAAGLTLLAYLPFLIAAGPDHLYHALIGISLHDKDYWTLPFPFAYHGGLGGLRDVKDVLDFYVPLVAVAGLALAALALVLRALPASGVALAVFGAGGLAYVLGRTDDLHTTPLLVVLAALLPLVAVKARRLAPVAIALLALLVLHGAWNRASALVRPPDLTPVHVPVADGTEAPPADARAIEAMVAAVQSRVPAGQPIYVLSARSDLVRFNNPLVYVLTERDNPTGHDFGLDTAAPAQARTVATLERVRPRAIVRWTDPVSLVREPNLRGRPTGVRTLDDWAAGNYRLAERDGRYEVLVPR
jgi:hypothetical protein